MSGRCVVQVLLDPLLQHVSRGGVASTSAVGKGKKDSQIREGTGYEKLTELLSKWEFGEHFHIPNDISIRLMDGDLVSTENESFNAIVFSKEQFNVVLCFFLSSLFKQFLHFMKIPPIFLHPNVVRVPMRCSILNMLFHLDLFLLEVFFIYTFKMSGKWIFSLSDHISSLQLVTGLPNSTKGAAKGHVVISSWLTRAFGLRV